MKLLAVTGSRADYGILTAALKAVLADPFFQIEELKLWGGGVPDAFGCAWFDTFPEMALLVGDRYEIMGAALAFHLRRVPIAHIGGGDVTEGSYDDAMRDCISRMASVHFATSTAALVRLNGLGYRNVHLVGNPAVDFILEGTWKGPRPHAEPYVVVSYQAETIDDTVDLDAVNAAINGRKAVWITPNPDRGNQRIPQGETFTHAEFLNLIHHCEEFIGNSSAILYEAPFMGVKTRMIGKRQRGRVIPWGGDGKVSERIRDVLRTCAF